MLLKIKDDSQEFEKAIQLMKSWYGEKTASKAAYKHLLDFKTDKTELEEAYDRCNAHADEIVRLKRELSQIKNAVQILTAVN